MSDLRRELDYIADRWEDYDKRMLGLEKSLGVSSEDEGRSSRDDRPDEPQGHRGAPYFGRDEWDDPDYQYKPKFSKYDKTYMESDRAREYGSKEKSHCPRYKGSHPGTPGHGKTTQYGEKDFGHQYQDTPTRRRSDSKKTSSYDAYASSGWTGEQYREDYKLPRRSKSKKSSKSSWRPQGMPGDYLDDW